MRSTPSELIPILRSNSLGRILADVLLWPSNENAVSELARKIEVPEATALRDVSRLVRAGYVLERRVGRSRVIRANVDHPIYRALRDVVAYGYGPSTVLPWAFKDVPGIDELWIIGSWADRFLGHPGHDPHDVDVLVVGSADPGRVYEAARDAGRVIGKDVNATVITRERWDLEDDGFVATVKERPKMKVNLQESNA